VSLRVIVAVAALAGVLIAVPAQADTKDDLDAAREELASKQAELDALTLQWQQTETAYAQAQGTPDIRELKLRDWEPRPMIARQVTKIDKPAVDQPQHGVRVAFFFDVEGHSVEVVELI